jgi:hypothetical protein
MLYQYPVVRDSMPNLDKAEATKVSGIGAIKFARLKKIDVLLCIFLLFFGHYKSRLKI